MEVRDYCLNCLSAIKLNKHVRCEFNFGGVSGKCSECEDQNKGGPCVSVSIHPKPPLRVPDIGAVLRM